MKTLPDTAPPRRLPLLHHDQKCVAGAAAVVVPGGQPALAIARDVDRAIGAYFDGLPYIRAGLPQVGAEPDPRPSGDVRLDLRHEHVDPAARPRLRRARSEERRVGK